MSSWEGLTEHVETPAALIDLQRVRANARRAVEYCDSHGLAWRPHVKTHKSLGIARIQLEAGARGLTVATPREAEVMAEVCDDLLLAYPPIGDAKLGRLMALPERVSLTVGLDSIAALEGLARAAAACARSVGILVEIDLGMNRVGVQTPEAAIRLAAAANAHRWLEYRGIMFYPGHIRAPSGDRQPDLEEAAEMLASLCGELDRAGLTPGIVSGGSSPTFERSHHFPRVTEIRAGTCIFNDRDMVSLGVCGADDCAYTILATVVSTSVRGQAVVDAGSKALSKEEVRSAGSGFGFVLGDPELIVSALSEEHGIIRLGDGAWRPAVGDRVRIVPNHVCVSVNLQDCLHVLEDGVLRRWPVEARGRSGTS